ncbi:MAG: hypothetical protein K9N52_09790 [Verrucomicrobia bacterium]|nr:hypothetical protein [Verrucomicrobiota bacterium]
MKIKSNLNLPGNLNCIAFPICRSFIVIRGACGRSFAMALRVLTLVALLSGSAAVNAQPILIQPVFEEPEARFNTIKNIYVMERSEDGTELVLGFDYTYNGAGGGTAQVVPVIEKKGLSNASAWFGANPVTINEGRGAVSVKVRYFNEEPGVPDQLTTDRIRMLFLNSSGRVILDSSVDLKKVKWGSPRSDGVVKAEMVEKPMPQTEEETIADTVRPETETAKPEGVEAETAEPAPEKPAEPAESEVTQPEPDEPAVVEADTAEAVAAETEAAKPEVVEAETAEAVEPVQEKPVTETKAVAEAVESEVVEVEPAESEVTQPEPDEPAVVEADTAEAVAAETEAAKPEGVEAETAEAVEPVQEKPVTETKAVAEAVESEVVEVEEAESEVTQPEPDEPAVVEADTAEAVAAETEAAKPEVVEAETAEAVEPVQEKPVTETKAVAEAVETEVVDEAKSTDLAMVRPSDSVRRESVDTTRRQVREEVFESEVTPDPMADFTKDSNLRTRITNVDVVNRSLDKSRMTFGIEFDYADTSLTEPILGIKVLRSDDPASSRFFVTPSEGIGDTRRNFVLLPVRFSPSSIRGSINNFSTDTVLVFLTDAGSNIKHELFRTTMLLFWNDGEGRQESDAGVSAQKPIEFDSLKQNNLFSGYVTVRYKLQETEGRLRLRLYDAARPESVQWFTSPLAPVRSGAGLQLIEFAVRRDAGFTADVFTVNTMEVELLDNRGNILANIHKDISMTLARPK